MKKLVKRLRKIVKSHENDFAYKINKESITYSQLWNKACYYADLLKREGNSPVIMYCDKSIDSFVMMIACIIANRPYVNVDTITPISRLDNIVKFTNSSLVISEENLNYDFCVSFSELDKYKSFSRKKFKNDIAYIIFTSGSTGKPKGVPISYDNLYNFIDWICNFYPLRKYKNINVLNQASFSFDLSVADMFYSLCSGHTLVSFDRNQVDIVSIIKDYNINTMFVTPTFIKLCLLDKDFNESICKDLKCIYFCGELLEKDTVKKIKNCFTNVVIINAYGPTEATSAVSGIVITNDMLNNSELLPVGDVNNFATDIEIINNEIILSGKSLFKGYIGFTSNNCFYKNRKFFFNTKDIGYIQNNMLYCRGRTDSLIKYKGYRIEIGDIESSIKSIDYVKDCVVIPIYNDKNIVKSIKAFILADNYRLDGKYIKEKLRELVPEYMIPKTIVFLEKFPINNNYKIDRKALINYDRCS